MKNFSCNFFLCVSQNQRSSRITCRQFETIPYFLTNFCSSSTCMTFIFHGFAMKWEVGNKQREEKVKKKGLFWKSICTTWVKAVSCISNNELECRLKIPHKNFVLYTSEWECLHANLVPILYHSEPSNVPYSTNRFLGWDLFAASYSKMALVFVVRNFHLALKLIFEDRWRHL